MRRRNLFAPLEMQFEQAVSTYDLRILLLSLVESGAVIAIKLDNGAFLTNCKILKYDYELDIVTLVNTEDDSTEMEVSLYVIQCIEFESFHMYRGARAKVFAVR